MIVPVLAVLLPVLVLFLGFAVDLSWMQAVRMEVRASVDAAARAGAAALARTGDLQTAENEVLQVAAANQVGGKTLRLAADQIEFGRNERAPGGRWVFRPGVSPLNAVRVDAGDAANVSLFFGRTTGVTSFQPTAAATAGFLNIDICLVLDRSTSMKVAVNSSEPGLYTSDPRTCLPPDSLSRWAALGNAVKVFTQTLEESSVSKQVAVATYSSVLSVGFPVCGESSEPSSLDVGLTTDMSLVDSTIDALSATVWNGNTFIESGMRTGIDELLNGDSARESADRVLIVLTDGNQNEGDAVAAASSAAGNRITIHTITFSEYANQALMQEVASRAGGSHYHANTREQLRDVFRRLAAVATQLTN
ncbi:MAG: vWA domain-containing protein [Planctomycetota bacterium]